MVQEFVSIPVPMDRVQEVYELLGRPGRSGSAAAPEDTGRDDHSRSWLDSLLLRAYRESSPAMKVVLDYLMDHAGETVTSEDLAKAVAARLDRPGYERAQLAGVFGAFGRRWANRYEGGGHADGEWPFRAESSPEHGMLIYMMSLSVAKVMRRARKGGGS